MSKSRHKLHRLKSYNQYQQLALLGTIALLAAIGIFIVFRSHAANPVGDINIDGVVNGADLSILAANYNKPGTFTLAQGDINGDQKVNITDLTLLAINWGTTGTTGDTTPPAVSLAAPTSGATLTGTTILTANASDNVGVTKVEFYDNGSLMSGATVTTAPFNFSWNTANVANGTHSLTAKAYDAAGNSTTSVAVSVTVNNAVATGIWKPTSDHSITWDWQLQGTISASVPNKQVYDIDGFDNTAATVAGLHAKGGKVICYIDFGTSENFRSDFSSFPAGVQGSTNGWPGEKWLDIRQLSVLEPIMTARMQMCVSKGFDALEPDNIDGYTNSTGFPLTAANQITYNTWIATEAHALGLSVGLKNDVDQTSQLVSVFDWALDEQCNEYSECDTLSPFTAANKAVFNAEYTSGTSFCAADAAAHINGANFDLDLTGATYQPCTQTW